MSRRRGEFEHRTSIFEGAFRAWSHLGGLAPEDIESKPATDIDPLTNPLEIDARLAQQKKAGDIKEMKNADGSTRREYPYEPLPRSGLAHPYVQAILSPWLGPDADNEAIQLGLTTLRTWWQHRRKGESGSAIAALGTEKMKGVVEGYTRHFFTLAHCLVTQDKEQPPRTLHARMKELEKARNKRNKGKKIKDPTPPAAGQVAVASMTQSNDFMGGIKGDLTDSNLSPLERLHAAQQRQLATNGMIHNSMPNTSRVDPPPAAPIINMKNKCVPGKIDLPGIVDQVNHAANQLAHRGTGAGMPAVTSSSNPGLNHQPQPVSSADYGDPNRCPVCFVSGRGENMIVMEIDGITCAHCVKIVETVLKGCAGGKSPIDGLLDAAADMKLHAVLVRIDKPINAKRVSFEAARNLSMVGYTAKVKESNISGLQAGDKKVDFAMLTSAFESVAKMSPADIFNWTLPCTCPDNGVLRDDCALHGQMSNGIFEAFEFRQKQVLEFLAGGGIQPMGPPNVPNNDDQLADEDEAQIRAAAARMQPRMAAPPPMQPQQQQQQQMPQMAAAAMGNNGAFHMGGEEPIQIEQKMDLFGMEPFQQGGMENPAMRHQQRLSMHQNMEPLQMGEGDDLGGFGGFSPRRSGAGSQRNPSIISYGGLRHMSINSETTFGRAMSGLSALSIDWENLEDFDLDVDHSAHINNNGHNSNNPNGRVAPMGSSDPVMNGGRRSSFRRNPANPEQEAHVSFKV